MGRSFAALLPVLGAAMTTCRRRPAARTVELRSIKPALWDAAPPPVARAWEYWLDLRTVESDPDAVKMAQQAVLMLFYSVRSVVDDAGIVLPEGAGVQGVVYDADSFDPGDAMGTKLPVYLANKEGIRRHKGEDPAAPIMLRTAGTELDIHAATGDFEFGGFEDGAKLAVAIPGDARLWAQALTNFRLPLTVEPEYRLLAPATAPSAESVPE